MEVAWGMLNEEEGKEPLISLPLCCDGRETHCLERHTSASAPVPPELERRHVTACEEPSKRKKKSIDGYGTSFHLQTIAANLKLGTKLSAITLSPPASFAFPPLLLEYKARLGAEIYI